MELKLTASFRAHRLCFLSRLLLLVFDLLLQSLVVDILLLGWLMKDNRVTVNC